MTTLSQLNGGMLKWGRERAALTRDHVAKILKTSASEIDGWEKGVGHLTLKKALDYANAVHVPFGYLYLKSPPTEELPIPDLRRRGDLTPRTPSVNFRDVINDVTLKQQWFRSFQIAQGASRLSFVGKFNLETSPEVVAVDIRDTLGINPQSRREASGAPDFLRFLVTQAESLGILVMRSGVVGSNNTRKLSVDEFSGFVMSDPFAPVIFINVNDASTAQVFTCVHELAHIWIGKSGISSIEEVSEKKETDLPKIEAFCNAITANVLIPADEFDQFWRTNKSIESVARHFRVSQQMTLRRAHDLNVFTNDEFFRLWKALPKLKASPQKTTGGNFHNTLPARNSVRLTTTLLSEVRNGRVLNRDASRLLGVQPSTLPKLAKMRLGE